MNEARVTVRPAAPSDVEEVRRLTEAFGSVAPLPTAEFPGRYLPLLTDAAWCLPVAEADGGLVGYALAQDFGPGLRATFTTGRVHDLFVDPAARRRGAGRALMEAVFAWARTRPQPMVLDWQASPRAVGFYESLGFAADRVGDYPEYPGFCLDLRP